MDPKFNIWFEIDGEVATSRWRMELLAAIGRVGSITAGAEAMGVPYRVAWQKIHEMEERLGEELLDTRTGGVARRRGSFSRMPAVPMSNECRRSAKRSDAAIDEIYRDVFVRALDRVAMHAPPK